MTEYEILRILAFLEQVRLSSETHLPFGQPDAGWNIASYLVRSYLTGSPVTISALVSASQVPYGTAMRRVHSMIDEGHVIKIPHGPSKKSYYLEPSPAYYKEFIGYIKSVKATLAKTVGFRIGEEVDDYYFGGADFASEIRPPQPLRKMLIDQKREIQFLLHDDNYFSAMRNMWADYRNKLASRRHFTLKPLPALHDELTSALSAEKAKYDVVAVNMPWLGEFVSKGLLRPLDDFITKDVLSPMDFHPAVWTTGSWGDQSYGVPAYCTVEILAARRDLFEEQDMDFPHTFSQVIDAGKSFNDPKHGRYGIAWNAAPGMPIATTFMVLMGCCGAPILNLPRIRRCYHWSNLTTEQKRPRVRCDEALQVLDHMRQLVEISPPDILAMDWNRRVDAFLTGEVAMAYCWSMRAARFEYDVASAVKRRVAYLPQPKGPMGISANPIGGFILAIPANVPDDRAELAFQAISWMASPEAMKKHATNGLPVAPRFSVAADPEVAASSPLVRFVDKLSQRGMLCSWQRPPIPEYQHIETTLGTYIHAALSGEMSDDQALTRAQNCIDEAFMTAH